MDDMNVNQPLRNESTKKNHSRQKWLQIYLPLIAGSLLLGALVLALVFQQVGSTSIWADISTVFLIIPTMIAALLVSIIFGGLVIAFIKLYQVIPPAFLNMQQLFSKIEFQVKRYSKILTTPVINLRSTAARIEKVLSVFNTKKG